MTAAWLAGARSLVRSTVTWSVDDEDLVAESAPAPPVSAADLASSSAGPAATPKENRKSKRKTKNLMKGGVFKLKPREFDLNTKKSFFCSELVAAAQITTGIIRENYNVSFFWPGSFAEGGAVDEAMVDGLRYGTEILIDCRDIEVGRARFY